MSFPVCGTVARGHGPVGEAEALRRLFDEEVDAASLAICSDALAQRPRAALRARIAAPASTRRRPMTLATVVHAVDHLRGRLREGVDAWDAIVATAAPVMVTGTPRAAGAGGDRGARGRAARLVRRPGGRGAGERRARVGTILRAAAVRDGVAEVRTGGDLRRRLRPGARGARVAHQGRLALARARPGRRRRPGGARRRRRGRARSAGEVALPDGGGAARRRRSVRRRARRHACSALGLALDPAATPVVLVGGDDAAAHAALADGDRGFVAIGDAAARVLRASGRAVVATAPQHGRLVDCVPGRRHARRRRCGRSRPCATRRWRLPTAAAARTVPRTKTRAWSAVAARRGRRAARPRAAAAARGLLPDPAGVAAERSAGARSPACRDRLRAAASASSGYSRPATS